MYVSDLALTDFRSYRELLVQFAPGPTAIVGPNGQGKTNLVEAIAYLSALSSHRVGQDTALVRRAAPGESQAAGAVVRAKVIHGERPSVLEVEIISGKANRARLNRSAVRPRELLGVLRTVVFAPEDLQLVREEPAVRRRFLDDLAIQLTPRLAAVRADHERILAQRAGLLKSARAQRTPTKALEATLEIWDAQLAAAAAQLLAARIDVVARLRPWVAACYEAVSLGQSEAVIAYRSSLLEHEGVPAPDPRDDPAQVKAQLADIASTTARLVAAMGTLHAKEINRGVNLIGAHRDDLSLFLGGLPAKGFASHGEQWSLALALRLASYEMLRHDIAAFEGDGEPVLVLDDVFASLDARRRTALAQLVSQAQQVLLTAAVDEDVPTELKGARLQVQDSGVSRG
ncbi:DNA replication and repair protein recF [Actinomyces bovis]|uniref:DNA replication and repair protein RecF n=1 Tax=Actinomyces bovis TaxID=1658 RepID=A0ABY1VRM7_9ACTO|nr:DNA replication/repair protein RecF [Actinomyces bovis]SPT54397.1 DNA replication and repair protein recF [Actinomyces bovis]VEG56042.1 DNA replication and repair protein recF [Actinomyces israelii]